MHNFCCFCMQNCELAICNSCSVFCILFISAVVYTVWSAVSSDTIGCWIHSKHRKCWRCSDRQADCHPILCRWFAEGLEGLPLGAERHRPHSLFYPGGVCPQGHIHPHPNPNPYLLQASALLNRMCWSQNNGAGQLSWIPLNPWAAPCSIWLLIKLTPKGVVFSFLFFSWLRITLVIYTMAAQLAIPMLLVVCPFTVLHSRQSLLCLLWTVQWACVCGPVVPPPLPRLPLSLPPSPHPSSLCHVAATCSCCTSALQLPAKAFVTV